MPIIGVQVPSIGVQVPVIGGSDAHYIVAWSPITGGQVLILGGSGANYRGGRCIPPAAAPAEVFSRICFVFAGAG